MEYGKLEKVLIIHQHPDREITPEEFFATRPNGGKSLAEAQEKIKEILRDQEFTETYLVFKWRKLPVRQSLAKLVDAAREMLPGMDLNEITVCVENGSLYIEGVEEPKS